MSMHCKSTDKIGYSRSTSFIWPFFTLMTYFPEIPQFNNPENVCRPYYVSHTWLSVTRPHCNMYVLYSNWICIEYRYDNPITYACWGSNRYVCSQEMAFFSLFSSNLFCRYLIFRHASVWFYKKDIDRNKHSFFYRFSLV